MSETRTAMEQLDAMLSRLEDGVLRADPEEDFEAEETDVRDGVKAIRSDIEALIGSRSRPATVREPQSGVGDHALGKVAETMARFGRRVGLGPHADGESPALRVRMAFSGARSETDEKEKRTDADRHKGVRDEDGKSGG